MTAANAEDEKPVWRGPFGGTFENALLLCGIEDLRGYRLEQLAWLGEQLHGTARDLRKIADELVTWVVCYPPKLPPGLDIPTPGARRDPTGGGFRCICDRAANLMPALLRSSNAGRPWRSCE